MFQLMNFQAISDRIHEIFHASWEFITEIVPSVLKEEEPLPIARKTVLFHLFAMSYLPDVINAKDPNFTENL